MNRRATLSNASRVVGVFDVHNAPDVIRSFSTTKGLQVQIDIAAALNANETVKVAFNHSGDEVEATVLRVNARGAYDVAWGENFDFGASISGDDVSDAWIVE